MEKMTCDDCIYFRPHYVKFEFYFLKTGCGHCVYPRIKRRDRFSTVCRYFQKNADRI